MPRILIVTGEASGDLHGANLAAAIRVLRPDAEVLGTGGEKMRAAGVTMLGGIERLGVVGLIGSAQLLAAVRTFVALSRALRRTRFDAVVFIDSPDLNLRLARVARRAGQRVIYYISPQIWAWRPWRVRLISRVVDHMIVILPFEEALYRKAGVPCTFVGHPLLDAVAPSYDRAELRKRFGHDTGGPLLALLPGSREREVRALLPLMLETAARLAGTHEGLRAVVAQAASIPDGLIQELSVGYEKSPQVLRDQPNEAMAAADLLLVASGTATLQAAVVGTPMIIVYRLPRLSYWIGRRLQRTDCIGLVNIVAGERFVTELLQADATPEQLAAEADRLLHDPAALAAMRVRLREVRESLGAPGASQRAAAVVLAECRA